MKGTFEVTSEVSGADEVSGFWGNLGAGLALALGLWVRDESFDARGRATLLLWIAYIAVSVLAEYLSMRPIDSVSHYGAIASAAQILGILVALHLAVLVVGQGRYASEFQVRVMPALMLVVVLSYGFSSGVAHALPEVVMTLGTWFWAVSAVILLPAVLATMRAVRRLPGGTWRRGTAASIVLVGTTMTWSSYIGSAPLFEPDYRAHMIAAGLDPEEMAGGEPAELVDVEGVYYAQPALMQEALERIRPSVPGKVELFALVAGLYPEEQVFLREVQKVGDIVEARFGAEDRVVRLLTSRADPERHPLANGRNMTAAVEALRGAMDPEDVLLIFLSSHGAPGSLSAGYTYPTEDFSVPDIAALLEAGGGGQAVAVINACYAGSFVPGLAADDRLIIAASAPDRTSFGCGDDSEWTYFARALFDEALGDTRNFPAAFEAAKALVHAWETDEGLEPSLPEMALGTSVAPALEVLGLAGWQEKPQTSAIAVQQ